MQSSVLWCYTEILICLRPPLISAWGNRRHGLATALDVSKKNIFVTQKWKGLKVLLRNAWPN